MTYNEEQKALVYAFLENTFFKNWRNEGELTDISYTGLELMLTPKCNLACSYCYYNNKAGHGKGLYPDYIDSWENTLSNTDALLDYLESNKFFPREFDVFAGDTLIHLNSTKVIKKVIDFFHRNNKKGIIGLPTNGAFLRNDTITKAVEDLYAYAEERGVALHISISIDGKYLDPINRKNANPNVNLEEYYSDEYYDKVFAFGKKYRCGFHPMIHHQGIELWKKNFDWFQEQLQKHEIAWYNIYLLEVRNDGWTKETVKEYVEFYKHVLDFAYKKLHSNKQLFINGFVASGANNYPNLPNMNMFNNISTTSRGIGCSLQTTMQVRTGDLSVAPCHRQSYDWALGFQFVKEGNKIVDIEPKNLAYYITQLTMDVKVQPYCESCGINTICSQGCPGSQLETNGDSFVPIQSVCLLFHGKVKAQIEFLKEKGLYKEFISLISSNQSTAFLAMDGER